MSKEAKWVEYPGGLNKLSQKLRTQLEDDFDSQDAETREVILAEIIDSYGVYYKATNHKPDALSKARRDCDRMINSAHKMLDSIKSMNDRVAPHYDSWTYRSNVQGSLKTALENHVSALQWAEQQLAIEKPVKPKRQTKPAAKRQFIDNLKALFERHNPPSETVDFDDNLGSFITDTLKVFDL
jgi:hypothetical protein